MQSTITILGSTGSIGSQTIEVLQAYHSHLRLGFLTTNTRVEELAAQVRDFQPYGVAIANEAAFKRFKEISDFKGVILCGEEGVCEAAAFEANTMVMSALVGFSGVLPTLAAIERGCTIALANKETLVSAGYIITQAAARNGVDIIAVDSEHSAILQCLCGEHSSSIEKLLLTASGGPFRSFSKEQLEHVSPEQALKHPNWSMGAKITIDSATLMNKGFELIEATWLFGVSAEKIGVVIHPQSIIHSMVQFVDGSVKAQLGLPDMKLPIHYALSYPHRTFAAMQRMDITQIATLSFEEPDTERFPCLALTYDALERGGTATAILNAANEVAVAQFLEKRIGFCDIPRIIAECLNTMTVYDNPSLAQIIEHDTEARLLAQRLALATPQPIFANGSTTWTS